MNFLLDPNVAYLVLLAAIVLAFLAVATPGTGLLEISALFCFVLAGYAAYNLSIHWWALGILAVSVIPFVLAIRNSGHGVYLGTSILLLVIGAIFLFPGREGLISVNPLVALISSSFAAVSLWFMLRKSMEAISRRPTHDLDSLVGKSGEAKSKIHEAGSVMVAGEQWSARSEAPIPEGSHVHVVDREGFVLVVEKVKHPKTT